MRLKMITIRAVDEWGNALSQSVNSESTSRQDDVRFLNTIISRTILPRLFILESGKNTFSFVVKAAMIIAYKPMTTPNSIGSLKGFRAIEGDKSPAETHDAATHFKSVLSHLGDEDLLSIKRVPRELQGMLEVDGVSLRTLLTGKPTTPDTKERTLRVVVDNPPRLLHPKAPATPASETHVSPTSDQGETNGLVEKYFDRLKAHVEFAIMLDSNGEITKKSGYIPTIEGLSTEGLVEELKSWKGAAEPAVGSAPSLQVLIRGSNGTDILIIVIGPNQQIIAHSDLNRLGRILIGWNALINAGTSG